MTGILDYFFGKTPAEHEAHRKLVHDSKAEAQKTIATSRAIRKHSDKAREISEEIARVAKCAIAIVEETRSKNTREDKEDEKNNNERR